RGPTSGNGASSRGWHGRGLRGVRCGRGGRRGRVRRRVAPLTRMGLTAAGRAGAPSGSLARPAALRHPPLMRPPTLQDIYRARQRIATVAYATPLERSDWLSELAGVDVRLKLECWQRTRSFKVRGAFNAVRALPSAARARGLVAASGGNHGRS